MKFLASEPEIVFAIIVLSSSHFEFLFTQLPFSVSCVAWAKGGKEEKRRLTSFPRNSLFSPALLSPSSSACFLAPLAPRSAPPLELATLRLNQCVLVILYYLRKLTRFDSQTAAAPPVHSSHYVAGLVGGGVALGGLYAAYHISGTAKVISQGSFIAPTPSTMR